ncbi:unnamed protein product [Rotaria magnacalcarata]|uniref:Uncharacterized protein n=1 Tax=Rotaria magnacalcarata TaxID=392030 RepID=A0A815H893_9BILA|nr:unnamed protein product [Rotaria magnacalcarata]CAF1684202.1 unnamed protein product [Rotaria magnacalcarata]CAF1988038.1 unnamed protein product [Rotaria magnacalcarata]CAF2184277.1 unnamed protein product [Rotaria magnacalcarata]CAF3995286.1 unnamed protein product [Rotaria magnacalcarata]
MEFNPDELNRFILDLFGQYSTNDDINNPCKSEPMEPSNPNVTSTHIRAAATVTTTTTTSIGDSNNHNKRFCFVIFNNPNLSQILNTKVLKGDIETDETRHTLSTSLTNSSSNDIDERSPSRRFSAHVEKVINEFMQHQKPPFSRTYILDLTDP